ncbi:hypothetical protein [Ruania zhangjianzhongii]|uniref:hypothetical protein n=1 Tax=Ruania zhangjianzhongii TaxID=2603206 RepID=UPI0011D23FC6|nr:hypothetical protein [Ruania zhangjianzhongii]
MDKEREQQSEIFHDSWRRLSWVEKQIDAARQLAKPWIELPKQASLTTTIHDDSVRTGHLEFSADVAKPHRPPEDINFLIGNIVTDARSCLDMAMEYIWNDHAIDRAVDKSGTLTVQFPIEDNFEEKRGKSQRLRQFLARMDKRFVEVIENAQPNYANGLIDIPYNISAIFIRNFSNANKHRNITPVVTSQRLGMAGTNVAGLSLKSVDGNKREGVPPLRFSLDYDTEQYSETDARSYVARLNQPRSAPLVISVSQRLIVAGDEVALYPPQFGGQKISWRAELDELLQKIPAYVRLTLRNLNRVHSVIRRGEDEFYLLDSDGTL